MVRTIRWILVAAVAAFPGALHAQGAPAPVSVDLPARKNQVLSVQPLSAIVTVVSGELERKLAAKWTLGVGGTRWRKGLGDDDGRSANARYTSGDIKLRYYPGAHALQGLSFGAQAGYTSVEGEVTDGATGEQVHGSTGGSTMGVALDYNLLLGASQSVYLGAGVGAKVLSIDAKAVDGVKLHYPTARFSMGYAF